MASVLSFLVFGAVSCQFANLTALNPFSGDSSLFTTPSFQDSVKFNPSFTLTYTLFEGFSGQKGRFPVLLWS
jgi:hypothetical protein